MINKKLLTLQIGINYSIDYHEECNFVVMDFINRNNKKHNV